MSENDDRGAGIELPRDGGVAFDMLMDVLAAEDPQTPEGAAAAAALADGAGAAAGDAGAPAAPAAPAAGQAPADGGTDPGGAGAAPAGRAADDANGAPGGDAAGTPGQPADAGAEAPVGAGVGTVIATEVTGQLGELSTAIEERVQQAYQQTAYDAAKEEFSQYFEALEKHPRMLVGTQVPAIGRDGMETLRDSTDAREWQEAVRSILVTEINARAQESMSESQDYLETLHASIDLFKNNADLIPGTTGFDSELANRFASLATPYEVRVDGKLHGYSIPVQPIIDNLRAQLATSRSAGAPEPTAGAPASLRPAAAVEPPQAGIKSKAGSSSEKEDFSTLFGTIGLPNLQI